jgi:predicted metal-dependent phosphoesterase TrpH
MNFKRFELHCHTKHSTTLAPLDCMMEPEDIIKQAKRAGLAGVAITDHDTIAGWKAAKAEAKKQGIIFIPGIEVSSRRGHILGLGVNKRIMAGQSVEATVEAIHDAGGVAVAAHPFDIRGYGIKDFLKEADAVEVFNALSVDRFSNMLAEKKAETYGKARTSGTDAHTLEMIGRAAISAEAHDLDSLLKEIMEGRVEISKRYVRLDEIKEWTRMRMIRAYIDVLEYIDKRYGRHRAWALKHLMKRFILSRNPIWDLAARVSLTGAIAYSLIKTVAYY